MVERFLFIVGDQNTGKSTQLRSLFVDPRLGTNGRIPNNHNVPDHYFLSVDRALYLRLTSPHERNETMAQFLAKIARRTEAGRWCVAAPLQPEASNRMPDVVETVRAVKERFTPERVRVCFLAPDRHGQTATGDIELMFRSLWRLGGVECHSIDARHRTANGTLLADYLDYS
jgi:hypothetical protein